MNTGTLTPRANSTIKAMRFTGAFGQPDGFGSILEAAIRTDGRAVLTAKWKDTNEHQWTVELDNEQRKTLAALLACYEPTMSEEVECR